MSWPFTWERSRSELLDIEALISLTSGSGSPLEASCLQIVRSHGRSLSHVL
jgi:hypothetical protein